MTLKQRKALYKWVTGEPVTYDSWHPIDIPPNNPERPNYAPRFVWRAPLIWYNDTYGFRHYGVLHDTCSTCTPTGSISPEFSWQDSLNEYRVGLSFNNRTGIPAIIEANKRPTITTGSLNWIQWSKADDSKANDHWYASIPGGTVGTWKEAKVAAEKQSPGAHLATINSKEENDFLGKTFRTGIIPHWIGLYRDEDNGTKPPIPKKYGYWRVHLRTGERTWVNGIADGTPAQDRANLRVPTTR